MVNYVDQEFDGEPFTLCPCECHNDGEPWCDTCFDEHVYPTCIETKEID